jgi:hypothetical protein
VEQKAFVSRLFAIGCLYPGFNHSTCMGSSF